MYKQSELKMARKSNLNNVHDELTFDCSAYAYPYANTQKMVTIKNFCWLNIAKSFIPKFWTHDIFRYVEQHCGTPYFFFQ